MKLKSGRIAVALLAIGLSIGLVMQVQAATPPPGPVDGSVGVEGVIPSNPPTRAATIATPTNGQTFTTIPVTVRGLCPANTLIKVFSNEIFVGSATCTNGSYSVDVSLFSGRNDLIARVFDALDQQGPDSNTVTVTYNDAQFAQFGSHVLITSQYARRAAAPNEVLQWPVIVSSGLGPYALSVDWGDGTPIELMSRPFAGVIDFRHTYKTSGVYRVTFKVVDTNGTTGYLQVIAVVTGATEGKTGSANGVSGSGATTDENGKTIVTQREIAWWPMTLMIVPAFLTFWLGRRYELSALRKRLEQDY